MEIIVIDDGSTDDGARRIRDILGRNKVKLISHRRNRGAPAARNTGIGSATGEWIAFLDSDDYWLPSKISHQLDLADASPPDIGVIYCGYEAVTPCGRYVEIFKPTARGDLSRSLYARNLVRITSCVMARRELLLEAGGFDERLPSGQGWEMWIRLAQLTKFDFVPQVLVQYEYGGPGKISSNQANRFRGHRMIYKKHLKGRHCDSNTLKEFHLTVGDTLMQNGRPKAAKRFFASAMAGHWHLPNRVVPYLLAAAGSGPELYRTIKIASKRLFECGPIPRFGRSRLGFRKP